MFGRKKKDQTEKKEKTPLLHLLQMVTGEQLFSDRTYGKIRRKMIRAAQVAVNATIKFLDDDCFTKASSIAYTVIVSLIPTLAVALTFFSIFGVGQQKEELFAKITKFMAENNLTRLNIDPYLDTLSSLIDNAAGIGGIGALVLIFSATAVLRTLEHSLNTIWHVKKERGWVSKMIYYWAALTLGPIMLIAGTTFAAQISTAITKPNYQAITMQDQRIWVAGNKADIRYSDHGISAFAEISPDSIDFDNQTVMSFEHADGTFTEDEFRFDQLEFSKADFHDICFRNGNGWVVGKNGIILSTRNGGKSWRLAKWGSFALNKIVMTDDLNGIIAADGGYMLRTADGGLSWSTLSWPDVTGNIRSLAIAGKTGIAVCDKGTILRSVDGGVNWVAQRLEKTKTKKRYPNLNAVSLLDEKHGWIAADDGQVLMSGDGFASYDVKHYREYKYTSVLMTGENEGYVGGENGVLLFSRDGGATWKKSVLHRGTINRLTQSGNFLWTAGDSGHLMMKDSRGKWRGEKGTGIVIYLINFAGPFLFVWLTFLLLFKLLPNTRVPLRPAAIGASITGAIWVAFILGFIIYVKSFANGTFAIYGALAAFPIFLLMVYTSAAIILYGAEVSYMIVHLDAFIRRKRLTRSKNDLAVYSGLRILFHVFSKFEKGKGGSTVPELTKLCDRQEDFDYFIPLFVENRLLIPAADGYVPATSSSTVKLESVVDLVHNATLEIPNSAPDDGLRRKTAKLFSEMRESNRKILAELTLADILKG